uniref:Uncharacterized protein n=1 Tax=Cacopsylla melanoneura TaxID=428564 RepID=A0A8D8T5E5_9HEMI
MQLWCIINSMVTGKWSVSAGATAAIVLPVTDSNWTFCRPNMPLPPAPSTQSHCHSQSSYYCSFHTILDHSVVISAFSVVILNFDPFFFFASENNFRYGSIVITFGVDFFFVL